jgi:hypothetical protein
VPNAPRYGAYQLALMNPSDGSRLIDRVLGAAGELLHAILYAGDANKIDLILIGMLLLIGLAAVVICLG